MPCRAGLQSVLCSCLAVAAVADLECPSYESIATPAAAQLDTSRYEGFWYEVFSHNVFLTDGCQCTRYNFTMQAATTFTDTFTCHKKSPDAPPYVIDNKGSVTPGTPGKMVESLGPASPPYWVLSLWDGNGQPYSKSSPSSQEPYAYALVYACVGSPLLGEYTYFFSRNSSIPDAQYDRMRAYATDNKIGLKDVKAVPMAGCTW